MEVFTGFSVFSSETSQIFPYLGISPQSWTVTDVLLRSNMKVRKLKCQYVSSAFKHQNRLFWWLNKRYRWKSELQYSKCTVLVKSYSIFFHLYNNCYLNISTITPIKQYNTSIYNNVYVLTNKHSPPVDGNFRDESGHAVKPHVIEDYNAHMGFVDKFDRMVNSYGIARRTWKWTKKLFFHFLDTILNAYLLHKTCSGKMTLKIPQNRNARFDCTNARRISRWVVFLEGGQVHLWPNWVD
jgi:hypothetical protein